TPDVATDPVATTLIAPAVAVMVPTFTPALEVLRENELPPLALSAIVDEAVSVIVTGPPVASTVKTVALRVPAPAKVMPPEPACNVTLLEVSTPVPVIPPAASLATRVIDEAELAAS